MNHEVQKSLAQGMAAGDQMGAAFRDMLKAHGRDVIRDLHRVATLIDDDNFASLVRDGDDRLLSILRGVATFGMIHVMPMVAEESETKPP